MINLQASATTHLPSDGTSGGVWFILYQPVLAIIFFTCVLAECNRAPFDLAEAEQELVGGYHTEYSSMKWALFFLGEYMHMITGAAFFALLFLGGWDLLPFHASFLPGDGKLPLIGGPGVVAAKVLIYLTKVVVLLFVMMWIRWTLPRFRFDQLMRLAWRSLIPISLVLLLITGVLVLHSRQSRGAISPRTSSCCSACGDCRPDAAAGAAGEPEGGVGRVEVQRTQARVRKWACLR